MRFVLIGHSEVSRATYRRSVLAHTVALPVIAVALGVALVLMLRRHREA